MKLSESDRRIIELVEHHAEISVEAIARAMKARVHTIRYALNRLVACGVLKRQYLFNLHRLGLVEYVVNCALSSASKANRAAFIEFCCRCTRVSYVYEVTGEYQVQVGFFALNCQDAEGFL